MGEGTTQIDLNIRGKTAKIMINVKDPTIKHIENIKLDKEEINLKKGESNILNVTINPDNTSDSKEIVWTSSNQDVASVDEDGKVTTHKKGTTIITAETINGKKATCIVTVKNILGDINGDGKVNIKDWNKMYEYISGLSRFNEEEFEAGDINEDGKVNLKDWNRLYEHISGINPLV